MVNWQVNRDQYTVTMDLGPGAEWVVEMQWPEGVTQGGPAVLVIYPADPDACPTGGLSQTVLRDVDFKSALDRLRGGLTYSKRVQRLQQQARDNLTGLLGERAAAGAITPDYLALLSRVYVETVASGREKPLEHLASLTGKSSAAIKNHLWQATRQGLLERSPGRAGGRLTEKGRAALESVVSGTSGLAASLADPQ